MKKITGKLSLQWRLTLITALLMTVTCILMYFFISQSAVAGMEDLGDYMIRIDNTDSAPITFNMNPSVLFPELSDQLQLTKKLFLTKGLMVTGIIILLSSICTYFISRQALLPLRRLRLECVELRLQISCFFLRSVQLCLLSRVLALLCKKFGDEFRVLFAECLEIHDILF